MERVPTTWAIREKIPPHIGVELEKYPNLIRQILFNRGIQTLEEADAFLRANTPEYSPFQLSNLELAVDIIQAAINNKQKIVIFGDYDVDGVTSSALIVQVLQRYQANVEVFIPNRFDEGYGLSMDAVKAVVEMGPDLIVTVDCGVRSVKEVAYLKDLGIKIIITDHHQPHDVIPSADAVVCPKQPGDEYPYKHLAGVGIAYKVAQGLLEKYPLKGIDIDHWIDLVAVGTVADLAPLDGENRTLVRRGLRRMRLAKNSGLLALANISGINLHKVGSEDIGFRIGPRLNAAGRMDSADLAFRLLMTKTPEEAGKFALELDRENKHRQQITGQIQNNALEKYDPVLHKNFLFFWDENFHDGVVGLAASKFVELFYRPAIVGVERDGFVRASCRSIPELNITYALDQCAEHLKQHGGHAMAAGLTISVDAIDEFMEEFDRTCAQIFDGKELVKKYFAEAEVSFSDLKPENLRFYELMEPMGNENPYPLFVSRNISIKHINTIGSECRHLKMIMTDGELDFTVLAWGFAEYLDVLSTADQVDILYAFEANEYNGKVSSQIRLVDFKLLDAN